MQILFCANPIDRNKPDSLYESEAEAAARLNFKTSLINFEALADERNPAKAIQRVQRPTGGTESAIYRGWMLTPEQYKQLYDELSNCGITLINDPKSYKHCHYLPEWLDLLQEKTPKTIWITKEELGQTDLLDQTISRRLDDLLKEKLAVFGSSPVIIKDYVKSEKHHWHDACFIPDASDHKKTLAVTSKFLQLRGAALEGGLVFRQFINFQTLATHSKSAMPLTKEFRLFVLDGKIIHWFNYWEEGDYQELQPPIEQFSELARRPQSRFFTMDIAQTVSGEWLVVELGDAQVSGLPENAPPEAFYQAIATNLKDGREEGEVSDSLESNEFELAEEERLRLISIAKDIISGKTMPLQGALQLWGAARYLEIQDQDPFASVIAFAVSDTDDLPMNESFRKLCSESFLLKKDIQTEELQNLYRADVFSACHEILVRYDV